ncbi:uncharacterized protein LOC110003510 [Xyrichtys novacula]|uniref:GTPase IMAP family member 8 n=1 Tax=Xyrichtys novacula TaxID=13765 RepID=A0AAV1GRL1_XYRNO|nr:uncharacterized protein LOC110003510 [Xyrichtys novacula]
MYSAMAAENLPCAQLEEQEIEKLNIMLLGKSGAGKSSSGNTILGRIGFTTDMSVQRVTLQCQKEVETVKDVPVDETGEVEDLSVTIIDTPGFFELKRKDEIVREILKRVKLQEPGPHAFVYVIPVGRMTQEDENTQALIEQKFGPRVWDFTIVLFTYGDRLEGKSINDVVKQSDDNFRNFIRKCSGGFHVFNNKDPQDQKQVTNFIKKIQTLVALNGGEYYKTELYPEDEQKIRKRQIEILAERDKEIRDKEKELEENHKGEELKMKKNALLMREEENARQIAEKGIKPLRIMLFGKGGVGKSSSGNTILGRHEFKASMSVQRVTQYCEKGVRIVKDVPVDETGKVEDVPVAVIDTPGLFEKEFPIGRMTQEDENTQALIEAMFGPRVWDFTIVLFTHGDRLEGKKINKLISKSNENLRNFIRKCGGGYHVFNNKEPEDEKQVTDLIAKIYTLMALNGGAYYHTDLYPKEERMIRKIQEEILAERNDQIKREERKLQERFQGKELEMEMNKLWREEEDTSRIDAEKQRRWSPIKMENLIFILFLLILILIGLALGVVRLAAKNKRYDKGTNWDSKWKKDRSLMKKNKKKKQVDDGDKKNGDNDEKEEEDEEKSEQSLQNPEVLAVTCGNIKGIFYVEKCNSGEKCIKCKDQWFYPLEFEKFGGRGSSKNWKASIRHENKPLRFWIEQGTLIIKELKNKETGASKQEKSLSSKYTSDSSSEEDAEEEDAQDEDWLPDSDKVVPREEKSTEPESKRGDSEEEEEKMESGEVEGTETELSSPEKILTPVLRKVAIVVLKRLSEKDCLTNSTNHSEADSQCDAVGEDTQDEEEGQFTTPKADEEPSVVSDSAGDVNGEESEEEVSQDGEIVDNGKKDVDPQDEEEGQFTTPKADEDPSVVSDSAGDVNGEESEEDLPQDGEQADDGKNDVDPGFEDELKLEIPGGENGKESTKEKGDVPPVEPQSTPVACELNNTDTPPFSQTIKLVRSFQASQEPQVSDMVAGTVPDLPINCNLDKMDLDELKREKLKMQVKVLKLQEEYYTRKIKDQKKNQD